MKQYDAIIIGFGKGGKTLAAELAKRNWSVAMIERSDKMYGGTCINIGCIPTKALVYRAKLAQEKGFTSFEQKKEYYKQVIGQKENITSALRNANYHSLADNKNITVYTGEGSFVTSDVVAVKTKETTVPLQSDHIFINTGAETVIPPIAGIKDSQHTYTSTSIMELKELPQHLVIIGGGYIGMEFASIYASFGSEVTVLEGYPELLPREDRDIAASIIETLEKKGIKFHTHAKVESVKDDEDLTIVTYLDTQDNELRILEADAVLVATGRKPYTTGLNLAAAGVEVNERGAIIVDEHLKTTNPAIRAIGDVKGGLQFTYISLDDYRIIREDLFGDKNRKTTDREPVSYSVFIDPPLSHIGLSEEEAIRQNRHILVKKLPASAIPRTKILGEPDGLLKAVIDADSHKVLGCTLFCPESSEIINTVAVAMKLDQDYTFLRDFIYTHPSMSEALNMLFS